ncbi:hypothetical protein CSX01_08430 [Pseudobutyrivibrio ruminis]|uniref:Uncharacterized protein n=1 Tax=Pseudobutyrivibrio ruminis TaxID=46206 RepID=A0A2G3DUU6_9FIRM|nr:hypothetical protein CSX01_08430 [Pseudobutyrivibrio ruminis]
MLREACFLGAFLVAQFITRQEMMSVKCEAFLRIVSWICNNPVFFCYCRFQKTRYNVPGLFCVPKAFKTFKEWWDKTNAHNIEQDGRYRYNYKQLLQSKNLSIFE